MEIAVKKDSKWGRLAVTLFSLPFCVGGLIALFFAIQELFSPARDSEKLIVLGSVGLTFTGFGLGLLYALRAGGKMQRESLQSRHPGQPWLWREDWAAGRVRSNTRGAQKAVWIFAVFWNLVSSPILLIRPPVWEEEEYGFIALIFPLIGAGLLYWAILQTLRARRFGQTAFVMDSVPAALGSELRGTIQTRFSSPPQDGVVVRLTCVRRIVSGSGDDRTTSEKILWRDERTIPAGSIMSGPAVSSIPVRFTIPADGLEANRESSDSGIFWFLSAEARLPGVDYKDEFEIPVFHTTESAASDDTAFTSLDPSASVANITPADLAKVGITVGAAPEGMEFRFAAARNKAAALALTAFTAIWTGICWILVTNDVPIIFPIVFGLFELLMVLALLDMWFGSTRVAIGGGVLHKRYSLLGIPVSSRSMPAADISRIKLKVGMQSGGRAGTPYYDIQAVLLNGKSQPIAGAVRNKQHADWLTAQISSALGLKTV
jgi:hypothetical protein